MRNRGGGPPGRPCSGRCRVCRTYRSVKRAGTAGSGRFDHRSEPDPLGERDPHHARRTAPRGGRRTDRCAPRRPASSRRVQHCRCRAAASGRRTARGAIQARQLAVERVATALLERSLLPGRLPKCPGLEFATRYLTPDELVGGDWYDVFTVPSGELWVVTGDVAGRGLHAAVVMGRVRSALRSYALVSSDPAEVLELTSRKVQHFEMDTMVTAVCATSYFPYNEFRIATAGHPPPLLVPVDGPGDFADLRIGPPLGVRCETRSSTVVPLPEGGVMVLYTDGLIERRGEILDQGMERLRNLLIADSADSAEGVCRRLSRAMVEHGVQDDVAIVAVRRSKAQGE